MEENKKDNTIVLLVTIISLLVISIVSVYLFFFSGGKKQEADEGLPLYKYEVYNGEFKYYSDKMSAGKIGLVDTLYYPCKNNTCTYVDSLFAGGNINSTKAVIKDGKSYILYDFDKKKTVELTNEDGYKYVDFINDNYLLINNNDKYYAYNIEDKTMSSEIVTDLVVTNLDNKPYIVWDSNLITLDNSKFGIVSLSSGNNLYENEYDNISCYGNYCLLTKDGLSNLYLYEKSESDPVLKDIKEVKFFNNKYFVYYENMNLIIYDLKAKEEIKVPNFNESFNIKSIDIKDGKTTIRYYVDNEIKLKEVIYEGGKDRVVNELDEYAYNIHSNIFFSNKSKSNITVKTNKTDYELKMDSSGNIYDNEGTLYDNVSIDNTVNELPKDIKGNVIESTGAYGYLNNLSKNLKLNDKERTFFINKYLPILIKNGTSIVNIELSKESDTYDDINILTKSDSFLYIKIVINKGKSSTSTEEATIDFDRKDNNIIFISGFSY